MKNEVVAVVLLYFGVAAEFILPLGGEEIRKENNTSKYKENVVVTTIVPHSHSIAHTVELPKDNSIIEKDLYEYGVPKNKNQSERAFIYIKKKFTKPNLLQHLKHQENKLNFDPDRSIDHVPPNLEMKCECKPKDQSAYFIDNQPFEIVDVKSYLAQLKKNKVKPEVHEHKMIPDNIRMPSQVDLEYQNNVAISKSLIFSSPYTTDNFDSVPNQNLPNDQYTVFDKLRHIRKSNDLSKVKQESKSKIRETYGYNSQDGRQPNLEFNEQTDNFGDSLNLQDLLAGDFEPEKSDYDDKLLDKYLKEDTDEESKSNETLKYDNASSKNTSQQKDEGIESGSSAECKCVKQ